jgi:hypothetical protein
VIGEKLPHATKTRGLRVGSALVSFRRWRGKEYVESDCVATDCEGILTAICEVRAGILRGLIRESATKMAIEGF